MRADTSDNSDFEGDWQHEPHLNVADVQLVYFDELVAFAGVTEPEDEQRALENRAFLPLLLISLLGHGLALYLLQTSDSITTAPPLALEVPTIQLRLVTRAEPVPEPAPIAEPITEAVVETDVRPLPSDAVDLQEELLPEGSVDAVQLAEIPAPLPAPIPAQTARAPTTLGVREIVQDIAERQSTDDALITCEALQQRNELIECGTDEVRDYRLLEGNFVVNYFNRLLPNSRPNRSIGVMAMQSDDSRERIGAVSLEGLDLNIFLQTLSNSYDGRFSAGDIKEQNIEDEMYAKDGTYQIMKRVMRGR